MSCFLALDMSVAPSVNGLPVFEHQLANGQICYDLLGREEYLSWRKKSLRLLDGICYVNGLPVFEHVLDGGQLVYGLLGSGNYSQTKEEYDGQVPEDSDRILARSGD